MIHFGEIYINFYFILKMQVGYRSTLRASQSISDLSHTANMDNRVGLASYRAQRPG